MLKIKVLFKFAAFQAFPAEHTEAQCLQRFCGNIVTRRTQHTEQSPFSGDGVSNPEGLGKTKRNDRNGRGRSKTGCGAASRLHSVKAEAVRTVTWLPRIPFPFLSPFKHREGKRKESSPRKQRAPGTK